MLEVIKGVDISKACGYDGFIVIRLLNYAVRVFMLLICIIHLVITQANESLQMLFLYIKNDKHHWTQSELPSYFSAGKIFPRFVSKLQSGFREP